MNEKLLKNLFVSSLLILISTNGFCQMKLIKKLLSNEADTTRSSSFLPLPNWELQVSTHFIQTGKIL